MPTRSGRPDWYNIFHGRTMYVTGEGYEYYRDTLQWGKLDPQEEYLLELLIEPMPQTKTHFVNATYDAFYEGKIIGDHHEAELFASKMLDLGYITFDPRKKSRYYHGWDL